jgi:hypothetical protein
MQRRYPQFNFDGVGWGLLEPQHGVVMARRAVEAVVAAAAAEGMTYLQASVNTPACKGNLPAIETSDGERIAAGEYVFACGPRLGKTFPELLGERIFPTRQEVFFFGVPAGNTQFAMPAMPVWLFVSDGIYGMPDLESRGFKIALDRHGEPVDPDIQSRIVSRKSADWMRSYAARRFPELRHAPIVETGCVSTKIPRAVIFWSIAIRRWRTVAGRRRIRPWVQAWASVGGVRRRSGLGQQHGDARTALFVGHQAQCAEPRGVLIRKPVFCTVVASFLLQSNTELQPPSPVLKIFPVVRTL